MVETRRYKVGLIDFAAIQFRVFQLAKTHGILIAEIDMVEEFSTYAVLRGDASVLTAVKLGWPEDAQMSMQDDALRIYYRGRDRLIQNLSEVAQQLNLTVPMPLFETEWIVAVSAPAQVLDTLDPGIVDILADYASEREKRLFGPFEKVKVPDTPKPPGFFARIGQQMEREPIACLALYVWGLYCIIMLLRG